MDAVSLRVQQMSERFRRAGRMDLGILSRYMSSGAWQQDYEAEERGEIAPSADRAVLSQDGLYNLLEEKQGLLVSSAEAMVNVIKEMGIVPFFRSPVPGYSIEELTAPGCWFYDENGILGPWDWKIDCVQSGDIAYGKFLCRGKAAFATWKWYREILNVRRASLSPDREGQKILEHLASFGSITSKEVRALLGVKKAAADTAMTHLQYQCRVIVGDIQRVYNGPQLTYKGWQTASFCAPEELLDVETGHTPEQSLELLAGHLSSILPESATRAQIMRILL